MSNIAGTNGDMVCSSAIPTSEPCAAILAEVMSVQTSVTPSSLVQYLPSSSNVGDNITGARCVALTTVNTYDLVARRFRVASHQTLQSVFVFAAWNLW